MIGVLDAPRIVDVPEVDEPMRLSGVMRQGAKLRPQNRDGLYFSQGMSCALASAYEGATGVYNAENTDMIEKLDNLFPDLTFEGEIYMHPVTGDLRMLWYVIISLNDKHDWTRERIADWLEGQGL